MPPSPPADEALDATLLQRYPLPADEEGDKRRRGTALVVGGGPRTPGAALLAGVSALRVGAGRLQIVAAGEIASALAVAVPEALVTSFDDGSLAERASIAESVVVGPGLEDAEGAAALLGTVLDHAPRESVVVVDALAILALAESSTLRAALRDRHVVLTPNHEELDRLAGSLGLAGERAVADELGVTVVSFGRVAAPDGASWCDPTPARGLGTSGAGDVLAGAAAGFGARCQDAVTAACWAALVHRGAAARLARSVGPVGYLARELADELPAALEELGRRADATA